MTRKNSISKVIIIVWMVFSIFYIAYNEWMRFKTIVIQDSYNQGVEDAVAKVIEEAKTCKAFPINVGESKATLVNVDCLKGSSTSINP